MEGAGRGRQRQAGRQVIHLHTKRPQTKRRRKAPQHTESTCSPCKRQRDIRAAFCRGSMFILYMVCLGQARIAVRMCIARLEHDQIAKYMCIARLEHDQIAKYMCIARLAQARIAEYMCIAQLGQAQIDAFMYISHMPQTKTAAHMYIAHLAQAQARRRMRIAPNQPLTEPIMTPFTK